MIPASQRVDLSSLSRKGVHNRVSGACSFTKHLETGSEFYIRIVTCTQKKMKILFCRQKRDSVGSTNFVAIFRLLWKKMQLTI